MSILTNFRWKLYIVFIFSIVAERRGTEKKKRNQQPIIKPCQTKNHYLQVLHLFFLLQELRRCLSAKSKKFFTRIFKIKQQKQPATTQKTIFKNKKIVFRYCCVSRNPNGMACHCKRSEKKKKNLYLIWNSCLPAMDGKGEEGVGGARKKGAGG